MVLGWPPQFAPSPGADRALTTPQVNTALSAPSHPKTGYPHWPPTLLCLERLPGTKGFHFALWFLFNVYTLFLPAAPAQPGRGAPGPVPPPLFGM